MELEGAGMTGVETIARIRFEHYQNRKGIKRIARELGLARDTVRKVLRSNATAFAYKRAVQPQPKLGPWIAALTAILEAEAKLPKRERRSTLRLFEELRGRGYDGAHDSVHRFVRTWRAERARLPVQAFAPLRFDPGEAYQFDWSHEGIEFSLRRPHFGQQANRIQARAQHFDAAAHRLRRARVRQEPLAGRRWRMIALADPCALALLPGQLERGLEDVHEQPCRRVEPGQSRRGRQPLQASIAHDAADHGAVLLLDEGLVVFAIGSTAREGDALRLAVIPYGLVDEHAVVVRVEPEQIEWHQLAQFAQHILEQHLLADQQRRALGPARGDIGQDERLHEAAARRRAAVGDQVRLDVAGRRVLPIGEGAHRDAA